MNANESHGESAPSRGRISKMAKTRLANWMSEPSAYVLPLEAKPSPWLKSQRNACRLADWHFFRKILRCTNKCPTPTDKKGNEESKVGSNR
jgi:hypothetical protein